MTTGTNNGLLAAIALLPRENFIRLVHGMAFDVVPTIKGTLSDQQLAAQRIVEHCFATQQLVALRSVLRSVTPKEEPKMAPKEAKQLKTAIIRSAAPPAARRASSAL